MARDLFRLLRPKTIAVVGGGAWCRNVVQQSLAMGFAGDIFCVHPTAPTVGGIETVARIADLPCAPDAVFLGINRHATVEAVLELSQMGAGGAVCFASGFSEASAEDEGSAALQQALVSAAGEMPILGPNCYGFVNALDGALLWPDQHGCKRVDRGVAILTQSSNIAINLSMQRRALPISFVVTCGNMAQTSQAEIAMSLLDDPRVTAIGLHIEGFGDTDAWYRVALRACERAVPLVALKVGASEQAQYGTVSHTASLAGSDAGAEALLRRLGIARVHDLPSLLATLMVFHCNGPLASTALSSISCSGGEAGLVADMALQHPVSFPPLTTAQKTALRGALGPMVATSNPLDYHTYVWGDVEKMVAAWLPMAADHIALTLIILDYPHTDPSAWDAATRAAIEVRRRSGRPVAVVATLPELLPEDVSAQLIAAGVTPLHGLREALAAATAAGSLRTRRAAAPLQPSPEEPSRLLSEAMGKKILGTYGVPSPKSVVAKRGDDLKTVAADLRDPVALKAQELAHKSEAGALRLRLKKADLNEAATQMPGAFFLVEEMVTDAVAELLVGVTRDPAHGFVLTLAAGGVLTELWRDRTSLLLPVNEPDIRQALSELRIYPLLCGFRGSQPADIDAIIATVLAVQDCVVARSHDICEIEINPLICTPDYAVAADALITVAAETHEEGVTDVTHQDPKKRRGP
jgi:acetyl-CoA synthetase